MGLLDKFIGSRHDENFTPQEAYMGILLCVIGADGDINDDEIDSLLTATNRMQLFLSQTRDEYSRMMDKLLGVMRKNSVGHLLEQSVPSVPDELRETAYATAIDLVFSDGVIEEDEKDIIHHLQQELKVSEETAEKIIEVMEIRNRG